MIIGRPLDSLSLRNTRLRHNILNIGWLLDSHSLRNTRLRHNIMIIGRPLDSHTLPEKYTAEAQHTDYRAAT